ncbi:bifunctional phosphoglucose/phosphomannose isomerase [Candidatus Woesearchaeota archaeon]|nr:bifunctional phosphoglucose/phosphomannose isomerase [Candidatus Woesearchaeota archaeon]
MTYDKENMLDKLNNFRKQIEEAFKIAKKAKLPKIKKNKISNIVVCGMGGSSAGGLLIKSFVKKIPVFVIRNYELPKYVNKNSLVFTVSYSGNTEETLSAYKEAKKRKATVIAVSSNGKLAEKEKKKCILIPSGYQPRIALAYTFIPILVVLSRYRLIANQDNALRETIRGLVPKTNSKEGFMLAKKLLNKTPIFYASDNLHGVVYICKTLTNENAKQPAFYHVFPEMNHNEINGFKKNAKKLYIVMIRDKKDHIRIKKRMEIVGKLLKESVGISELPTKGKSLLARMLHTLHIIMYTSYYLALMNKIDPTPVPIIQELKAKLKK